MGRSLRERLITLSRRQSLLILSVAVVMFLLTILIEVTIIVESPQVGDVSGVVSRGVQVISAVGAIFSIYEFLSHPGEDTDSGPVDQFVVEGDMHGDFNFHIGDPTSKGRESNTNDDKEETEIEGGEPGDKNSGEPN